VNGARVIGEISFEEVAQLGAYGSRVVHHGCLEPLRGRSIQVFVSGTRLVEEPRGGAARVVALASRRGEDRSLVGVVGEGIALDPAIRSRILSSLAAAGARGDLEARPSGRSGLSCSLHPDDLAPALRVLHEHFFTPAERSQ
jgi:aspartokinase